MELAICPTCKQSVLDDDATECPFCGSPMKAGAGARPSAAAKPAAATGKPRAKPSNSADDDPFGVDPSIAAKAILLSPRPGPGRTFEVKCPMCETLGYGSPKVAGSSVRCCNPSCMVPVFTVKAQKKEEAPPPPTPKKASTAPYYLGGGAVLVAGALGTVFYLNSIKAPDKMAALPANPKAGSVSDRPDTVDPRAEDPGDEPVVKTVLPVAVTDDRAAQLKESLNRTIEAALKSPTTKKAYARRLAALALIHARDQQGAEEQLIQLKKYSGQNPYESIQPLALYCWTFHELGSPTAQGVLEELKPLAAALPKRGRFATESAIAVAALWAASGELPAAREVLNAHRAAPRVEQLAGILQLVNLDGTFDVDAKLPGRLGGDWQAPLETTVTLQLCQRGQWEAARDWSVKTPDPVARDESVLVYIEAWVRDQLGRNQAADLTPATALEAGLTAPSKARLAIRLAAAYEAFGNSAASQQQLASAVRQLNTLPVSDAPRLGSLKAVFDARTVDPLSARQGARAATEIARVQVERGQKEDAWKSIQVGLRLLRGAGPGSSAVRAYRQRLEGNQLEGLRREIKRLLALANEDQVKRELGKFRQRMDELEQAAQVRFKGQANLLEQAFEMGLHQAAWKEILAADGKSSDDERDPLLSSALPPLAAMAFEAAGDAKLADSIRVQFADRSAEADADEALRVVPHLLALHCRRDEVPEAIELLKPYVAESGEMQLEALQEVSRLIDSGKVSVAMQLVQGIPLESLREDGLYLLAARAARLQLQAEVKKLLPKQMKETEAAAVHSGLASGLGELECRN